MQHRANFYEGFNLRGLPYYKQRELLANARPWSLGYEPQLSNAPKFRNQAQLKERENWLLQLGLNPNLAHELAMSTMEQPEFNLQHFQQRWHGLCQHYGTDRCSEANTIVLREIRELMQRSRAPVQLNMQQARSNLPMSCGSMDYPTNTDTLKYINELASYQRRTSTPLRELSNMDPVLSKPVANPINFELSAAQQKYNSNAAEYARQKNFNINAHTDYMDYPQEDAYNIDTDPRNSEELNLRKPPEFFEPYTTNYANQNYNSFYDRNEIFCNNVAGERPSQRNESDFNSNNVNYPTNNPYRNGNGYNYNSENRSRKQPEFEYEANKPNDDYSNQIGGFSNLENRRDNYENRSNQAFMPDNDYYRNTIGQLRANNRYNLNNILSGPSETYKNSYNRADNAKNNYPFRNFENFANGHRTNGSKYSLSELDRIKFHRREIEIQRNVESKIFRSDARNPRKRHGEPIDKPEQRTERKRRVEEVPQTFQMGDFKMPYVTHKMEPLPQPERKSYAIDFCQRKHVLIVGGKNAIPIGNMATDLLPPKFSRQSCKNTRKLLRTEWAKVYEKNDYRIWLRWWKDFKWCQEGINMELKRFNGLDLAKEVFHRDSHYYERPHAVDVLLKKAAETLQVDPDKSRAILHVLFELMNENFLRNLTPDQQGEVQDMLRYYPNSTWVYKMRFMIYLWARCNRIQTSPSASPQPPDMDRQIYATHTVWNSGDFHWLAKQAYDELISISEYEWSEHKNVYPVL